MRRGSTGLNAISLLAMLFLYGPIFVLVLYSFNAAHLSMAWRGATLKWYEALHARRGVACRGGKQSAHCRGLHYRRYRSGGLIALGMDRMSHRRQQTIEGGLMLPLVIPEVMMGVALMLFFVMFRCHSASPRSSSGISFSIFPLSRSC